MIEVKLIYTKVKKIILFLSKQEGLNGHIK